MTWFLWTMLVLCAMDSLARVWRISQNDYDPPTPGAQAFNAACNAALAVWAATLLFA